jgi:hypothetical protein
VESLTTVDPQALQEVVTFLREWLPASAIKTYRDMIDHDPEFWHRHPHFANGVVVKHFLRGNGITERVLGVEDLEEAWPEILLRVVTDPDPGPH